MIRIVAPEPAHDPTWVDWSTRAQAATEALLAHVAAGQKPVFREALYKEQRDTLLQLFHEKCAYCETVVTAAQHKGDVEHYRPKGRVTDAGGKLVFVTIGDVPREHPGYYWLAYDWWNLMPSCIACNRPARGLEGEPIGKWDRFPVSGPHRWRREDIEHEEPLLLNPRIDDPNEHLRFDSDLGLVGWRTPRGEATVTLLDLNRDALVDRRRRTSDAAYAAFLGFNDAMRRRRQFNEPSAGREAERYRSDLLAYREGTAEYAATGRAAIQRAARDLEIARREAEAVGLGDAANLPSSQSHAK